MLFNIEHDGGNCIIGYVVPDGYSGEARLKVRANGQVLLELTTTDTRSALVAAGRHETGKCGFILDGALLPGIEAMPDLEIFEVSNDLLIYRRPQKNFIKKKILRIDTHLFPLRKLDFSVRNLFQYHSSRLERFGKETIDQLFLLNSVNSIFLSGRIMYKNYQHYIEGNFSTFFIMQDPYDELAERLLTLKILSKSEKKLLSEREEILFSPVMAYIESLSLSDTAALKRCITNMPRNVVAILSNPIVRQLTVSTSDEMPQRLSVASALDVLSSCELVCFRDSPDLISKVVAGALELEPRQIDIPEQLASIRELGAMLREMGAAESFLERDIELYQNAREAARAAGQYAGISDD